jgi:hypothetical protein
MGNRDLVCWRGAVSLLNLDPSTDNYQLDNCTSVYDFFNRQ